MQITYSTTGNADASFINDLSTAINILDSTFTNNVTINIKVGDGVNAQTGQTLSNKNFSFSAPSFLYDLSYSSLRADLLNSDPNFFTSVSLPNVLSVNGVSTFNVSQAQARMFGMSVNAEPDGYVSIGTGFSAGTHRIDVMLHEITHALGRYPGNFTNGTTSYSAFDLFRFLSNGNRDFDGTINPSVQQPVAAAYFSLNGGATKLADFGVYSDPSDFLNAQNSLLPAPYSNLTSNDPFDEFVEGDGQFTTLDDEIMEALGFHIGGPPLPPPLPSQIHVNDLTYSGTASGPNHFIDPLNFEASYPDLIAAFGTNQTWMENWYNTYEPIETPETFDGLDYVASFSDMISGFGGAGSMKTLQDDGALHYIIYGQNEGLTTTFNGLDFIASYADLTQAFGANNDAGAFYFIEYGYNEHLPITFDGLDYIASYPDLINAFGANEQAGAAYFINYGHSEGLTTTFDGLAYIAQYTDLMHAFGANNDAGASHYIEFGHNEGRSTSFNVSAYETAHPDLIGKYASNDAFLTAYINTYDTTGTFLT